MIIHHGKAKGHPLRKPIMPDADPVYSATRAILFPLIAKETGFDFKNKTGLDLFAGSGALGLEALSVGAAKVDFVDKHPSSCEAIKINMNHSVFLGKATVYEKDVQEFLLDHYLQYDFVFVDPDYKYSAFKELFQMLPAKIRSNGIVVLRSKSPITFSLYPFVVKANERIVDSFFVILQPPH